MPAIIRNEIPPVADGAEIRHICGSAEGLDRLKLAIAFLSGDTVLQSMDSKENFVGTELLLVPLDGTVTVSAGMEESGTLLSCRLGRSSPLEPPSGVVYVPPGSAWKIETNGRQARVALLGSRVSREERRPGIAPLVIKPEMMSKRIVGKENWQREVRTFTSESGPTRRLIAGETLHLIPGGWSSFPPHKHDTWSAAGERPLEEFYYYRCQPVGGFGMQLVYGDGVDFSARVRDGDCVIIDRGYHPVVSTPGTIVYYLWALAGDGLELGTSVDPEFSSC